MAHVHQPLAATVVEPINDNDAQDIGEDDDLNPTLPEDLDYDNIRRMMLRFERLLQRRTKRHASELAAVADMQQLIAAQQAELVTLQSTADSTFHEMQGFKDSIAELSERQASMVAVRARSSACAALANVQPSDGIRYAQKCVSDIVAGVQNFSNELPEAQALLQQLAAAFDAARRAQLPDPKQPTLQAVLSRQAVPAQTFDMASGSTTPATAEESTAADGGHGRGGGMPWRQAEKGPA